MACAKFFRRAALSQQCGESWHNCAIYLLLIFRDFKNAQFTKLDTLIQDEDFMGMKSWNIYDVMRTKQQK